MSILVVLIFASLGVAVLFLAGFVWSVRSGQYEDTLTPSLRVLAEDSSKNNNETHSKDILKLNEH